MTLAPGTRLGPYEIQSAIGAGGMGEVYRARDTRLDRTVAIKVLSPELAADAQFRERFQREARTISALDHPHICALYDVGEQERTAFLVMQHLEGETLAARLEKGALPVDQAVQIGVQIADALDKAHRQGIVHRDLKPGNIMLTRTSASRAGPHAAKLLDFGLARMAASAAASSGASIAATEQAPLTAQGTILGTFQYMAPEQIEGQEADARSDVFAFGVVLYEMLTGRKAFTGKTAAGLAGAILKEQPPPLSTVRSVAPPALDHLVRSCLEKDPDERIQTMHDVLLQLRWIADTASSIAPAPSTARRSRIAWMVAGALGVLLLLTLATGFVLWPEQATESVPARFTVPPPDTATYFPSADIPAVSPDGRHVLFVGQTDTSTSLWVRPLDSLAARLVRGTEGGFYPFWAPDGRSFAFSTADGLKTIDLAGGPSRTLSAEGVAGGTWNQHGDILIATVAGPIVRIPATSGEPKPVTVLDKSRQETQHRWPSFLPDGRHFVYLARSSQPEKNGVFIASLDSSAVQPLVSADSAAVYAIGHLLYVREDILMAQPFDVDERRLAGDAVPVASPIAAVGPIGGRAFAVSANGVLVYRSGSSLAVSQLVWFDRNGRRIGVLGEPGDYSNPAIAPDGKRVAVGRRDPRTRTRDLWLFDVERGSATRLTFNPAEDLNPVFSRDGRRILFTSSRTGSLGLYSKASTGVGEEEPVFHGEQPAYANDLTPDGRFVVYDTGANATADLWVVPVEGERPSTGSGRPEPVEGGKPVPFLVRPFIDIQSRISSDGRWIAYSSNESGRQEVYVQDFPKSTAKWRVSPEGGFEPMWRADGKELFFISGRRIMATDVRTDGPAFQVGATRMLFETNLDQRILRNRYVVSPDGQRFLVVGQDEQTASSLLTVVVNWVPSKP